MDVQSSPNRWKNIERLWWFGLVHRRPLDTLARIESRKIINANYKKQRRPKGTWNEATKNDILPLKPMRMHVLTGDMLTVKN